MLERRTWDADAAVIGAGPAGLEAAARLGPAGLRVVVLDEYPVPGGRLLGQLYQHQRHWFVGREVASRLLAAVTRHPGVRIRNSVSVYGVHPQEGGFRVDTAGAGVLRVRACLVATGATEVPVPLPGWTLPGVVTVGAAQVLTNVWGVPPGPVGVVVGLSPLAFAISQELAWAGVTVRGIVMPPPAAYTEHLGGPGEQWSRLATWGRAAPWWAKPGVALMASPMARRLLVPLFPKAGLKVAGSRLRPGVAALAVEGQDAVSGIRLSRLDGRGRAIGTPWVEPVDFVALAGGLRPVPDLLVGAGAEMVEVAGLGGTVPLVGPDGATTVPGLYAAGNAIGVEGARVAMAQGLVAALGLIRYLRGSGLASPEELRAAQGRAEAARAAAPLEFQPGVAEARVRMAGLWQERSQH